MKANFKRIMRHPIMFSRTMSPFTLAHHPQCQQFGHHCITVRGHQLCIGCFIGFPTTLLTLFALIVASSFGIHVEFFIAVLLGFCIELVAVLGKVLHFSKRVSARVGLKIVQSMGFAFIFFAPLTMQLPIVFEVFILFILWMASNGLIGAMRVYETEKTCGACEYKGNWSKCPGFKNVIKKLCEAGFLVR